MLTSGLVKLIIWKPIGCLEKREFSSEDKERKNQKAQHT